MAHRTRRTLRYPDNHAREVKPLRGQSPASDLIGAVIAERVTDLDLAVLDHLEIAGPSMSEPYYTLRTSRTSGPVFEIGGGHVLAEGRTLGELFACLYSNSGAVVAGLLYEWELGNMNCPENPNHELPSGGPVPNRF